MKRNTRVSSEAVRRAAVGRSIVAPMIVDGISPGKLITIPGSSLANAKIEVDPCYQRGKTNMVGEIIRALQAGGSVLDPITLCRRPWSSDPHVMWIVDGYQRYCALQELGMDVFAIVHDSQSLDAEKRFFISLNSRVQVNPNTIVKGWAGPSGQIIRAAAENPGHCLFDRIEFGGGSRANTFSAGGLAKGMSHCAVGWVGGGTIVKTLPRLDVALSQRLNRAQAEHFLMLAGYVFPSSRPSNFMLCCLGAAAREQWKRDVALPSQRSIERMSAINWEKSVPALVDKWRPTVIAEFIKLWK